MLDAMMWIFGGPNDIKKIAIFSHGKIHGVNLDAWMDESRPSWDWDGPLVDLIWWLSHLYQIKGLRELVDHWVH